MPYLKTLAATAAVAFAAATATPAPAAQILLDSSMFRKSPGANASAARLVDSQTGDVSGRSDEWVLSSRFGYLIIDLGAAYDFSYFDIFTKHAEPAFSIAAGNDLRYDGFNYYLDGSTTMSSGPLVADPGDALTAQRFVAQSDESFRYLQIAFGQDSTSRALTEFRVFDGDTPLPGSAAPEPASWALMIGGFALAGAALRRRRVALGWRRHPSRP
jgi:hypothetical protein